MLIADLPSLNEYGNRRQVSMELPSHSKVLWEVNGLGETQVILPRVGPERVPHSKESKAPYSVQHDRIPYYHSA